MPSSTPKAVSVTTTEDALLLKIELFKLIDVLETSFYQLAEFESHVTHLEAMADGHATA
jgi:hypothetical protein